MPRFSFAADVDSDNDSLTDDQEINIYHTDPNNPDTDGDGFNDGEEVRKGYSPLVAGSEKFSQTDFDKDGLTDELEIKFGTDLSNPDTDDDGYTDGEEVRNGYDPNNKDDFAAKLTKTIEINLKTQKLKKILGKVTLAEFIVSTGKPSMPTPVGTFKILKKTPRAWSKPYKLWMPYFMLFTTSGAGIHELPEWPNGTKEGANHLGKPVSHGCVRLGVGPAKEIFNWAELGTVVRVVKK